MVNEKKVPLTTQIACFARAPVRNDRDDEEPWRWDWEDIAQACYLVARDAARMAGYTADAWNSMAAEIEAQEADDLAAGGRRLPLNDDGTPITFEERAERGEYVVYEQGAKVIRLPKPLR